MLHKFDRYFIDLQYVWPSTRYLNLERGVTTFGSASGSPQSNFRATYRHSYNLPYICAPSNLRDFEICTGRIWKNPGKIIIVIVPTRTRCSSKCEENQDKVARGGVRSTQHTQQQTQLCPILSAK